VIAVAWGYTGLNPEEMEGRITTFFERSATTTVDNIEHIESTTINGRALIKIFLQPGANVDTANAQVTASAQSVVRQMPSGITPPLVMDFDASTVPILQLSLSGEGMSEQQLNDLASNFLRIQLVSVPGVSIPSPYGGKQRQVMVNLDTSLLQSKGLSPMDVVNGLSAQVPVLPSGTAKIGRYEYDVDTNASPRNVAEIGDVPLKASGNSVVYLRDVATVSDGLCAPDQHRPARRTPGYSAEHSEDRQRFNSRCCWGNSPGVTSRGRHIALLAENQAVGRSVDLRPCGGQRRGARSDSRGLPDRHHDHGVSWKLA
jgi:multidrug efflux pump subunit AcrB